MKTVYGLRDGVHRRVETERDIGHSHIVIDSLGQGHDVETRVLESQGILLGAAPTDADQGIEMMTMIGLDDGIGHVPRPATDGHPMRLVPAGAEDGAAVGKDAGQHGRRQVQGPVLDQAPKSVAIPHEMHSKVILTRPDDGANRGVEARTIATAGQDANLFSHSRDTSMILDFCNMEIRLAARYALYRARSPEQTFSHREDVIDR